jgi:transcriptional regulator with XRE-family HTH domain
VVCVNRRPHPLVAELAAARHRLGLTQREVAERALLTPSLIGAWEAGWKTPQLPGLIAYARAVGCEIAVVPAAAAERQSRRAS